MTSYAQHYRSTLKLGVPLCIGQIGVILVGFADTLMVGHYGTNDLASVSFVNNLFNLVIIGLLGFSYGITPIIGALFARQKYDEAGAAFRNALIANALFGILLTVVMGCAYFFIDRFGQPDELLPIIRPYYLVILASIVFVALFNAMRQFADSLLRPSVGMWILISGNAVNIVFNYLLIYGKCGMPELGALGAGISTLGSRVLMTVVFAVVLLRGRAYAPMRKAFLHTRESVGEMLSITRTSMPISLQMAMETGTFTFGGVMMGWLGTVELASYQVILTISTLGFMFYYSIGAAVAIRVSNYVGRGNQAEVRRSTWAGYHILLAHNGCCGVVPALFRQRAAGRHLHRRQHCCGLCDGPDSASDHLPMRRRHTDLLCQRAARHRTVNVDDVDCFCKLHSCRHPERMAARLPVGTARRGHFLCVQHSPVCWRCAVLMAIPARHAQASVPLKP